MTTISRDYERIFVGERQIDLGHFYPINWTEDDERPTKFAVGYWTPDGVYTHGTVGYSSASGFGTVKACH